MNPKAFPTIGNLNEFKACMLANIEEIITFESYITLYHH